MKTLLLGSCLSGQICDKGFNILKIYPHLRSDFVLSILLDKSAPGCNESYTENVYQLLANTLQSEEQKITLQRRI